MTQTKSIATPIVIAFSLIGVFIILSLASGIWSVQQFSWQSHHAGKDLAPQSKAAMETLVSASRAGELIEVFAATHDEAVLERSLDAIDGAEADLAAILDGGDTVLGPVVPTDDETLRALASEAQEKLFDYRQAVENRLAVEYDEFGPMSESATEFLAAFAAFDASLDELAVPRRGGVAPSPEVKSVIQTARLSAAAAERRLLDLLTDLTPGGDPKPVMAAFKKAEKDLQRISFMFGAPPVDAPHEAIKVLTEDAQWIAESHVETVAYRASLRTDYTEAFEALIAVSQQMVGQVDALMAQNLRETERLTRTTMSLWAMGSTAMIAIVLATYFLIRRRVVYRLRSLARVLTDLNTGANEIRLPDWTSEDELGLLREKVVEFKVGLDERNRLEAEARETLLALTEKEKEAREQAADLAKRKREADELSAVMLERQTERETMSAELERVVARVASGDLSARLDNAWSDDQLNTLAAGVNGLIERIGLVFSKANAAISAIAEADLRADEHTGFEGAFGQFQTAIADTAHRLADVVRAISGTGAVVSERSSDVTRIADQLSRENTDQAATVADIVTSVQQISAGVDANASTARNARDEAREAAHQAEAGDAQVDQSIDAVRRIAESSAEIVAFVNAIEEIAFQTNLLALNASVEAARAGSAGKGFSVVASEVRALSQRTTDAADQIKTLIDRSETLVGEGVSLAEKTGTQIARVREVIDNLQTRIETVDRASAEQADAVRSVATAIARIDDDLRAGADRAQSCNVAAQSLSAEAIHLSELVAAFRLPSEADVVHGEEADWNEARAEAGDEEMRTSA